MTALGSIYGCSLVAGLHKPKDPHCSNGILDQGEEHVDCGGADCPACDNDSCTKDEDCASLTCGGNNKCTPVDCTRLDAPCWACHTCGVGKACASNADCLTGLCDKGTCQTCTSDDQCPLGKCGPPQMPGAGECLAVTCSYDGGSCGGMGGAGGTGGSSSSSGTGGSGTGGHGGSGGAGGTGGSSPTTTSGPSSSSTSASSSGGATCIDGKQNGDETDVDCGGSCPACIIGNKCGVAGDCMTGNCVNTVCRLSSCMACGLTCGGCPLAACTSNVDCWSDQCSGNVCQ